MLSFKPTFPLSSFTFIKRLFETGKVVWYFHLFQNFPQFVVIHIVKGFSIVTEAEVGFFWNALAFSMKPFFSSTLTLIILLHLCSSRGLCGGSEPHFTDERLRE